MKTMGVTIIFTGVTLWIYVVKDTKTDIEYYAVDITRFGIYRGRNNINPLKRIFLLPKSTDSSDYSNKLIQSIITRLYNNAVRRVQPVDYDDFAFIEGGEDNE